MDHQYICIILIRSCDSPWEEISPYYEQYNKKFSTNRLQKYASMISNMDANIGRLLSVLDELDIARDTIVLFTSDNGPEGEAGSTGPFSGRKRTVTEGGYVISRISASRISIA